LTPITGSKFNKGIIMNNIKDMVKNKTVRFLYFKENELFYITECGFEFPVPISDVGTASMKATDKAILFMRWIRKEIDVVEEIAVAWAANADVRAADAKSLQREVDAEERYYRK